MNLVLIRLKLNCFTVLSLKVENYITYIQHIQVFISGMDFSI